MDPKDFSTIRYEKEGGVASIVLNRPEIRNAFNDRMIDELYAVLETAAGDAEVRVLLMRGEGKVFCAGADLSWMKQVIDRSFEENMEESLRLARLFESLSLFEKPIVAAVHGASIGGGNGLVAACDIAIAAESTIFSLSEVKLGLIPSAIGPHVIRRVGEGRARALFLSGERIDGRTAQEIGLVYKAVPDGELDEAVRKQIRLLLTSGPCAMAAAKRLVSEIRGLYGDELNRVTARSIAELRVSPEGQEGMRSFLEKRKPAWLARDGSES